MLALTPSSPSTWMPVAVSSLQSKHYADGSPQFTDGDASQHRSSHGLRAVGYVQNGGVEPQPLPRILEPSFTLPSSSALDIAELRGLNHHISTSTSPAACAPEPVTQQAPLQQQTSLKWRGGQQRRVSSSHGVGSGGSDNPPRGDRAARRSQTQKRYREQQATRRHELEEAIARLSSQAHTLSTENHLLRAQERVLEKLVGCRDEQLQLWARIGPCKLSMPCDGHQGKEAPVPSESTGDQVNNQELEKYRRMNVTELRTYWKVFTARAAELLMQPRVATGSGGGAGSEADVMALAALVADAWGMIKHVVQLNCPTVTALQQINLESGTPAYPPEDHWTRVIRVLDLSPQQHADLAAMAQLYSSLMENILEERRVIKGYLSHNITALTAAAAATAGAASSSPQEVVAIGGLDTASEALMSVGCSGPMECADRLLQNLRRERTMRCLMSCCFFGRLPTPLQLARLAVTSYPYFPCPMGILASLSGRTNHVESPLKK